MATLIPAEFPPLPWGAMPADRSGWEGERAVYDLLRSAPADWTVIHDLNPPAVSHTSPQQIDLLVIVPKKAILVLEVKNGHYELHRGRWRPVNPDEDNHEADPLSQAKVAMDALRAQVEAKFGRNALEARLPYGHVLVLANPESSNPPEGMQAITLERDQSSTRFHDRLDHFADRAFSDRSSAQERRGRPPQPRSKRLQRLLDFLIPDVPVISTAAAALREANAPVEERFAVLLEQQFEGCQSAMDNPRVRFEGAGGTGKTMVAMRLAHLHYEAGARVALVCHNRLLGEWMRQYLREEIASPSDAGGTLTVGRIWNDFARPAIESDSRRVSSFRRELNRASDNDTRYGEIFPRYARQAFRSGGQFDYLIVDEFQDLCREPFLEVLDASLVGGLSGGKWAVFADFDNQALHEAFRTEHRQLEEEGELEANLELYSPDLTKRNLLTNCRNTPAIAEAFSRMSGRDKPEVLQSAWSDVAVVAPRYRYWQEPAHLEDALNEEIAGLVARGWTYDNIVLLSGRRLENQNIDRDRHYGPWLIKDRSQDLNDPDSEPHLRYCTVDSFKGLESEVVILILEGTRSIRQQGVAYVGGSRAKYELITLAHGRTREALGEEDSGPPQ